MTFAKTMLRASARRPRASLRGALLGLVVLQLLVCVGAAPAFAGSSGCAALGCGQQLTVALSGEAAAEEGEEDEGEEAGEEENEEGKEGAEGSSEEEDEEAAASAEAEAEAEVEERRTGKRHGARRRASGGAFVLSKLHLTHKSLVSLSHNPAASQVEFSFSLARSMKVRVTLVKQGKPHAHKRWMAVPADSLTISATKGSSRHRLLARNRLAAGRYRLTVWPVRGRLRSIYLSVRG